jgi:Reverse transcriptase (RNA-dependent DNA polymerase)
MNGLTRFPLSLSTGNLYKLVQTFLAGRTVRYTEKEISVEAMPQKGCPQGSVLGPLLWSIVFDEVLGIDRPPGVGLIAYADDLAVIVRGNSRKEVEERSTRILQGVCAWMRKHKLKVSTTKTVGILLKGRLDAGRPPRIPVEETIEPFVGEVRYLGVYLGAGLSFAGHVEQVTRKAKSAAGALQRIVKGTWKLGRGEVRSVYSAVCLGILGYGISVWGHCIGNVHLKRKLVSAQRAFLLLLTGACRTVSNDALQVLAGKPPIDLELAGRMAIQAIGADKHFSLLGVTVHPIDRHERNRNMRSHLKLEARRLVRERIRQLWQDRWSSSPSGRITYG